MSIPSESSMLAVGTVLNGMYRIVRHLSSGGFGNTYVATNLTFGDRVAVKEFFMRGITQRDGNNTISVGNPDNRAMFHEQLEKFKKEAQRIRHLRSPHIVRVHDMFDANGTAYYVMDYIDGESLSARQKRTKIPLHENAVRRYLGHVLDALECIHSAGLLHMDLKPENIMIDQDDNAVLIDFGASKRMYSSQYTATMTSVSYTNGYAPPEQLEQDTKHFGAWTDIYALGATLYMMLTDRKPPMPSAIYSDSTPDKLEALPFPTGVSTHLQRVIVQMLAVRCNARPQSVAALRNMLAQDDIGFGDDESTKTMGASYAHSDDSTKVQSDAYTGDDAEGCEGDNTGFSFLYKWVYGVIGLLIVILIAFLFFILSGKKTQTEGTEAGAERIEATEQTETDADDTSIAKAGENSYMAYDNKKGYTIDIPGGLFKYKNSILDEKDGEEGLLQYSLEKDNNLTNIMSVYFKEKDDMTPEAQKKDFEEWKEGKKDNKILKEEIKDNTWTLIVEQKTEYATSYEAIKHIYNPEKKVYADIEIEYNETGKEKFTDEVINHIFDSFKFK